MLLLGEDGVVGFNVIFLEQFLAVANLHIKLITSIALGLSSSDRLIVSEVDIPMGCPYRRQEDIQERWP